LKTQSVSVVATFSRPRGKPISDCGRTVDKTAAEEAIWKKGIALKKPLAANASLGTEGSSHDRGAGSRTTSGKGEAGGSPSESQG